jgi:tRNA/tmRNA/rRNA uracil-C5-methylase (TrmA/RlmC/RlmD family)
MGHGTRGAAAVSVPEPPDPASDRVELTIERPVAGGWMLARHDGRVVLVAGAIPGETIRARLGRAERGVAFARVDAVLTPSPNRRVPPFDPACGGGVYAHIRPEAQAAIKRDVILDGLRRGAGLDWTAPLDVVASPETGYRLRARLHVGDGRVGFFREGTHTLCDAGPSAQLDARTLEAVTRFAAAHPQLALEGIEVSENLAGDQRALFLHEDRQHSRPGRVPAPVAALVDGITGVSMSRGGRLLTLAGVPEVADPIGTIVAGAAGDAPLRRHAASFFQGNRYLLGALATAVVAAVPDGPAVDLYAGVGLFAVGLCATGHEAVVAVEGDPVSGADLRANSRPFGDCLGVDARAVETFLADTRLAPDTTVVIDPPRTGLSRSASTALGGSRVRRLVAVSCDVATFARDLKLLRAAGFEMTSLVAYDLFPNTAHVETLAVLQR